MATTRPRSPPQTSNSASRPRPSSPPSRTILMDGTRTADGTGWHRDLHPGASRWAAAGSRHEGTVSFYPTFSGMPVLGNAGLRPDPTPHPYRAANGAVTYRDPDGRDVVFAPWVYGEVPDPVDRPEAGPPASTHPSLDTSSSSMLDATVPSS